MKLVLIDDDKLVCSSLKTILSADPEIEVAGMGYHGQEAVLLYEEIRPDILLMDIRMEPMSGLEAGKKILAAHPDAKILYLTTFLDDEYIIQALNLGAKGYMLKQDFDSILSALKAVYLGHNVYGTEIISKLPQLLSQSEAPFCCQDYDLSEKEYTIICKIAEGLSNKEIAEALYLSEGTIRNYISLILEKLALRDRTQIAIFYYKHLKG